MKTAAGTEQAGRKEWIGLGVIALPCALYSMDLTVLNLAVPRLSVDLKPTSVQLFLIGACAFRRHRRVMAHVLPRGLDTEAAAIAGNTIGGASVVTERLSDPLRLELQPGRIYERSTEQQASFRDSAGVSYIRSRTGPSRWPYCGTARS